MNNSQSLYLLWATILNQSQNAEQVLQNTLELFKRLGLIEEFNKKYKFLDYKKIEEAMIRKPCLHRFPKNMSINLASSIYMIDKYYEGVPSKIFQNHKDIETTKEKLMQFRGIGEHKANTAITILEIYKNNKVNSIFNSNCQGLYKTIGKEIEILDKLGDEIDYDR